MKETMLNLIGLQCLIGELCDIARENKEKAATELLNLEPRMNDTINRTFMLLDQLPINEADTISICPS